MKTSACAFIALLLAVTSTARSLQDYPIPQEDQEKRRQSIDTQHPAGPPLLGTVKALDLQTGVLALETKEHGIVFISLSKKTKLMTSDGSALTLGDLLADSLVSVDYVYSVNGGRRIALRISKPAGIYKGHD